MSVNGTQNTGAVKTEAATGSSGNNTSCSNAADLLAQFNTAVQNSKKT